MKSYMKDISSKFTRQNKDIFVSDKIHAKCTMYHESKKFWGKAQKRFGDLYAGADPGFF